MLPFKELRFERSVVRLADCPGEPWPEIALSGRSNVGKSSLLNGLCGRREPIARVSKTPGKTRGLNFYRFGDKPARLVDLPGYGFANVPESVHRSWRGFMRDYMEGRAQLAGVVQLVDSRHAPTALDREMVDWLRAGALPFAIVLTKADKLGRGALQKAAAAMRKELALTDAVPAIAFSTVDGLGHRELMAWIDGALAARR